MALEWNLDDHNRKLDIISGDQEELEKYLRQGEHLTQDFKFRIDSSIKIARTLAAFANTSGGRLLIGVKDNGKVTGVDPEEEFFMIEGAADLYCRPKVPIYCKVYPWEDRQVLVVNVPESPDKPHKAREDDGGYRAYVRQNDQNFLANKALMRFLKDKTPQSQGKNLIAYGPAERQLFDYLSQNTEISISKFTRIAKIPLFRAEKIVASFLKWRVIEWVATDKGIRFRLREAANLPPTADHPHET